MAKYFGGPWTDSKLSVLESYLVAYLKALRKQRFNLGYIDAFAGDGSIVLASSETESQEASEIDALIQGSAQRALQLDFDGYVFIEQDLQSAHRLHHLKKQFTEKRIKVIQGDANVEVQHLCLNNPWQERRAVVFLDPTGMQVQWQTLEAIAATEAIDVWIWFPLGIGVNRLLTRSGEINDAWQERLDTIFGTKEWRTEFYKITEEHTLFGRNKRIVKVVTPEKIAAYWIKRLKTIFPVVAPNPAIMRNSRNNPIYLLCFASANRGRGGQIALKIAQHLLDHV